MLVPSVKVKRPIRLFDSSPSKMTKGKKAGTKAATALAHMAVEFGREEAAAGDTAAPAANKSITGTLASFDASIIVAKNSDSDLTAASGQERTQSDGEGVAAAGTVLTAGAFQTPKGSAPASSGVASTPKGGMASRAKSAIMRSFLNISEKSTSKRNREDWAASLQLANKAKRAAEVAQPPPQRQPQQQQLQGDQQQQGQEYQAWQIKLYDKMRAMGRDAIPKELYKGFLDLFTSTHEGRVMVQAHAIAKEVYFKESELQKCKRSLLIHNVDKWVEADKETEGYSLADRATAAVHKLTCGIVTVQEAFPLGQWKMGQPPTSVDMTFGSTRRKTCFFRVLANKMRAAGGQGGRPMPLGGISCRDAFPKDKVNDAKALVEKGMGLKRNGKIAAFRVVARGPGCIPVLEARYRRCDGRSYSWEV